MNLIHNALQAMPVGGELQIATAPKTRDDQVWAIIEVRDTGEGLSENQIENLFQPFNRLEAENSEREGVGIGLVISKHLIELMGGAIGVSSVPGAGTTFWVELAEVTF